MTAADRPTITPRVGDAITTAEQLDALPVGIVMRSRNDLLTETGRLGAGGMRVVWGEGWSDHAAAIEHHAPLTVLYVPGEQGRPTVTDDARAVREAAISLYRAMRRANPDAWAEVGEVEDWAYWDDIARTAQVTLAAARADTITVPRPHVPNGPQGVTEDQADTDYLRKAARDLAEHYKPFGSNLRATVVKLLNDAADALAAARTEAREGVGTGAGEGDDPAPTEATSWVARSTDCPEAPAQAHLLPSVTDDARAEMRRVLENQFGPFLARDPHDPDRFWDLAVDAVMRAADRAETTTDLHWSNAAAAEYPGDEYEQYPLRTAFGRGVKWERKRAARKGIEQ